MPRTAIGYMPPVMKPQHPGAGGDTGGGVAADYQRLGVQSLRDAGFGSAAVQDAKMNLADAKRGLNRLNAERMTAKTYYSAAAASHRGTRDAARQAIQRRMRVENGVRYDLRQISKDRRVVVKNGKRGLPPDIMDQAQTDKRLLQGEEVKDASGSNKAWNKIDHTSRDGGASKQFRYIDNLALNLGWRSQMLKESSLKLNDWLPNPPPMNLAPNS